MNTPGGNTVSTAQLTLSLLASLARKIPQADMSVKEVEIIHSLYYNLHFIDNEYLFCLNTGKVGPQVIHRSGDGW